jgi:DNA (cytosine-5)-methyltransferase 1
MGYHRAGWKVVGVDVNPQPNYPFEFIQMNALHLGVDSGFDAIHASPPCQRYSTATRHPERHPDLYGPTVELLKATGLPWVVENVPGAPHGPAVTLCGSMFGLRVRRHRIFESSFPIPQPECRHKEQGTPLGVYGHSENAPVARPSGTSRGIKARHRDYAAIMEMPWAEPAEIAEAIPPAYTEYVARFIP